MSTPHLDKLWSQSIICSIYFSKGTFSFPKNHLRGLHTAPLLFLLRWYLILTSESHLFKLLIFLQCVPWIPEVYKLINLFVFFLIIGLQYRISAKKSERWRENYFPPVQFMVTKDGITEIRCLFQSLLMGSWENWQKPAMGKNSYQFELSLISVYDAQQKEKGKISHCPFLFKFRLMEEKHQ